MRKGLSGVSKSRLMAIGMVISVRQKSDEVTEDVRYSILSEYLNGDQFAKAVRQHWSVENNCHWQLDVLFREDGSRVRERTLAIIFLGCGESPSHF